MSKPGVHQGNHGEVPLLMRAAILGYWWHTRESGCGRRLSSIKLSGVFGVPPTTIDAIIGRATMRARQKIADEQKVLLDSIEDGLGTLTLEDLLEQLHDAVEGHARGRNQVMPPGSRESGLLEEAALRDREHWDMPFPELAKDLGTCFSP